MKVEQMKRFLDAAHGDMEVKLIHIVNDWSEPIYALRIEGSMIQSTQYLNDPIEVQK